MINQQTIYFLVFDGFEMLDFAGPSAVFSTASRLLGKKVYKQQALSIHGGLINTSANVCIETVKFEDSSLTKHDTLLVMGASTKPLIKASLNKTHQNFINQSHQILKRIGSICSGTFLLAEAGVLNNHTATTHWQAVDYLSKYYKDIKVKANDIYVSDSKIWTSAGVTTGIDMALAMVAKDFDKKLSTQIAKQLIVYSHRPGHQSQFSNVLEAQSKATDGFDELINWLVNNINKNININLMADFMNMSSRTLQRKFSKTFNQSPAKFLEILRLEQAREYLESGLPIKQVHGLIGYKSEAAFRKAFENYFGLTLSLHKSLNTKTSI